VFCPQGLGQVAEQCGRSFGKAIFWGKDLPKLRLICFLPDSFSAVQEGAGGMHGGFFGGGLWLLITIKIC